MSEDQERRPSSINPASNPPVSTVSRPSVSPLSLPPPPTDEIDADWGAETAGQSSKVAPKPSANVASKPPVATDDLDADWGSDTDAAGAKVAEKPVPVPSPAVQPSAAALAPKASAPPAKIPTPPLGIKASAPPARVSTPPLPFKAATPPAQGSTPPLGIKASAPPAKIPTPTLGLKAAAASSNAANAHKKTLIGIAPVIPPPPAVPDVDFPDVPPPPPPSLEAAAPAALEPVPAAALVGEGALRDVPPATVAAKTPAPEVDRESAPPPVDAIAPVTFSEHPPSVAPREEQAASALAKPKELDPTPSGPVRSETPLSTGPETFDPVTSFEPARRSPNWALIAAAAAVVLLVGYWIQRGPAGPKVAATSAPAPLEVTPAAAEPPKAEAPKLVEPSAVPDSKPAEATNAAPEPSAAASASSAPASASAAAPVPSASANAAAPEASASASPSAGGEGMKTISIVTRPPGARIFHHGKEVGTTPLTIDLPEGEKRKFEVGLPGHITRKLIVDGTKTEIVLGMRPAK